MFFFKIFEILFCTRFYKIFNFCNAGPAQEFTQNVFMDGVKIS